MGSIVLGHPNVSGSSVRYPISAEGSVKKFFNNDLRIKYDRPVDHIPRSILILPAIGNLLPLAWAADSRLRVKELDSGFSSAVGEIREVFNQMYPELSSSQNIVAEEISETDAGGSNSMTLFSGGVDSLTTYIRHQDESPILVAIQGADISFQNTDAWERVRDSIQDFASSEDVEMATASSNFREMLEYPMIHSYYENSITGNWWGGVQHGLALLTHCAPLAYDMGVSDLYIASTHTEQFSPPWGSSPEIDNAVAWSGTTVTHDGYELSRQEKVYTIAEHARKNNTTYTIRSCYKSHTGNNCSKCEKCCRTIVGLEIAGVDPAKHGYEIREGTFKHIQESLSAGDWNIGKDERYMWNDLQSSLPVSEAPHENAIDFFDWFQKQDINRLHEISQSEEETLIKMTPYLKYLPESVYTGLKTGKQRLI